VLCNVCEEGRPSVCKALSAKRKKGHGNTKVQALIGTTGRKGGLVCFKLSQTKPFSSSANSEIGII
jgi:hypothetical protein